MSIHEDVLAAGSTTFGTKDIRIVQAVGIMTLVDAVNHTLAFGFLTRELVPRREGTSNGIILARQRDSQLGSDSGPD